MDLAVLVFQNEVQANIFAKIIENNSLSSAAELQNHIAGILVEPEDPLCYLKTRLNFNFAPFTTSVYQSAALDEMVNLKYAKNMLKKASIKTWADIKKTKLKRIPCYVLVNIAQSYIELTAMINKKPITILIQNSSKAIFDETPEGYTKYSENIFRSKIPPNPLVHLVKVEKGLEKFEEYIKEMYKIGEDNIDQLVLCSTGNMGCQVSKRGIQI